MQVTKWLSLSKIKMVMDFFIVAICVIGVGGSYAVIKFLEDAFHSLNGSLDQINPNSVTAGYEVFGVLFGFLGAGIGWVAFVFVLIILGGCAVYFLIPSICCLAFRNKANKRIDVDLAGCRKILKTDALVSIFFHIPPIIGLIYAMADVNDFMIGMLIPILYFFIIEVLSFKQFIAMKNDDEDYTDHYSGHYTNRFN